METSALTQSDRAVGSDTYTAPELAELSQASLRQIEEWSRTGLLPAAVPTLTTAARGRPLRQFPASALATARDLKCWRRFVTGPEDTMLWLWLQGHDHIDVDTDTLEHRVVTWLGDQWNGLREKVPSLHNLEDAPPSGDRRDQILNQIDSNITRPISEAGPPHLAQTTAAMVVAMVGLADSEEIREWCRSVTRDRELGVPAMGYTEALFESFRHLAKLRITSPVLDPDEDEEFVSLTLPTLSLRGKANQRYNWPAMRHLWKELCQVTDSFLATPEEAPIRPLAYVAAWRRRCYASGLEPVLLVLSIIAGDTVGEALRTQGMEN